MLYNRVTSTRPTAYARSEANIEQIVDGLHEQAVCSFQIFFVSVNDVVLLCSSKDIFLRHALENTDIQSGIF